MYQNLKAKLRQFGEESIEEDRQKALAPLIAYGRQKLDSEDTIQLNFICTHNSRRSQFAQVWAKVAAHFYGVDLECFSGGVEVTAFNKTAVNTLKEEGFEVSDSEGENPHYNLKFAEDEPAIEAFSKLYDAPANPKANFAAVMTCSHADENCPFIPGAEARIALNYEDPKKFDGTEKEAEAYRERSRQIATEMMYVFKNISS